MPPEKLFTTVEVGAMLQVTSRSVAKWADAGELLVFTTPGGHRRVRAEDLLAFMRKHGRAVPAGFPGTKRKILFVDDYGPLCAEMKRAMRRFANQAELFTAESGVQALVMIGQERPDVLFLDQLMPGMSGLDVLAQLKASAATSSIEVVLMTGLLTPSLEQAAFALGAKAVKEKPILAAEIVELCDIRASS